MLCRCVVIGIILAIASGNHLEAEESQPAGAAIVGSGSVILTPVVADAVANALQGGEEGAESGRDQEWHVELEPTTGNVGPIAGNVRLAGVKMGSSTDLGAVTWQVSGSSLSGTIASADGDLTLASFEGTVSTTSVYGTFTTIDGQKGSWVWDGPKPEEVPATEAGQ